MTASSRFITYVFFLGVVQAKFMLVKGDCWYDNKKHEENSEVPTGEPCLNCTCNKSVLLCYLRVCTKLPNPPPPGCILLHRYRTCCPELICSDFHDGGNSLEARTDPEGDLDIPSDDQSAYKNACISNGSIYGPGSAMHSSSSCEYCYCLAGKQVCVKPKCLLPIEGCSPIFEDTICCPVRYHCTRDLAQNGVSEESTTPLTTSTRSEFKDEGGCIVDGTHYPEGSKVIGIGHSVCDNCYCLRGLLRCEPLSCAPPLLGCTPVVKPGECCAASYNCNGTLEIEAEPNYGLFPTISKEYSKLRKEVQRKPPSKQNHPNKDSAITVAPFYVLAETLQEPTTKLVYQRSPDTYGTTRHFSGASFKPSSTQQPLKETSSTRDAEDNYFLISSSKQRSTTAKPSNNYYATSNYEFQNANNYKRVYSTTLRSNIRALPTNRVRSSSLIPPETKEEATDYLGFGNLNILSIVDSLLDGKTYRRVDDSLDANDIGVTSNFSEEAKKRASANTSSTESSTLLETTTDTTEFTTNIIETTAIMQSEVDDTTLTTTDEEAGPVTVTTVLKSTDCINGVEFNLERGVSTAEVTTILPIDPGEVNKLAESKTDFASTTDFDAESSSSESSPTEEISFSEVKSRHKLNINNSKLPPDIEAILNISKHKNGEDFDYDYNEPTLPPSLPNLKIIPFLAADALDAKKESPKDPTPVFIQKKVDVGPLEYSPNMFKPPVETEGGFVPKEPSIIDTFYNSVASAPSITSESNVHNDVVNCISEGQQVQHGVSVASKLPCTTCTCFYGNIVCQKSNCPPPKPGCKIALEQGGTLCCPNYVCGEPRPLEISEVPQEIVTVAEGIIPQGAFGNVIKTEPAPNLHSLIGNMISMKKNTSIASSSTEDSPSTISSAPISERTTPDYDDESLGLDKVLQFIFSGIPDVIEKPLSQTPVAPKNESTTPKNSPAKTTDVSSAPKVQSEDGSTTGPKPDTSSTTTVANSYLKIGLVKNTTKNNKLEDSQQHFARPGEKTKIQLKTNNVKSSSLDEASSKGKHSVGVGLLKLAGCNIYGRMYRVGRIISELSGPCLECKCTEIGVQCRQLRC